MARVFQKVSLNDDVMNGIPKLMLTLVLVIFFVGLKAFYIAGITALVIYILYKIKPEWFWPD